MMRFVLTLLLLSSCKWKQTAPEASSSNTSKQLSKTPAFHLFDPNTSRVESSNILVQISSFGVKVPSFNLDYSNNTYVQILRCGAAFHSFLEDQYKQVANEKKAEDRKWVWVDTLGNTRFCRIVTLMTNAKTYADLAAPNGNFFYVINPCVSADYSQTGKDECSYALTFTQNFQFSDALSDAFILESAKLADAESKYDATVLKFLGLTQELKDLQDACLAAFQNDQSKIDAQRAWGDLGTVIGGGVLTGVLGYLGSRYLKNKSWESAEAGKLKNTLAKHPYISAGLVMTGAGAISLAIRRATETQAQLGPYCAQADKIAKQIAEMQSKNILDKAKQELLDASSSLSKLNDTFTGYDNCILTGDPGACAK